MQNITRPGLIGNCQIHRNITAFGGECPQCYRDRMNRYSFSIRQRNRALNDDTRQNNINRTPQRLEANERNINLSNHNNQNSNFNFTNRTQNTEYQNLINQNRINNQNNIELDNYETPNERNSSRNFLLPSINISTSPPVQRIIQNENNLQPLSNINEHRTPILLRRQNTQLNVIRIPTISTYNNNFGTENEMDEVIGISMASAYPRSRPVPLNIIQQQTTVEGYSSTRTGNCVICQIDLNKKDATRSLPCNHTFHIMCIDRWFCERNTCPTCRDELK